MSINIILGAQWGDEGKGKVIDYLSENTDYVIRYQGGANAGHTIILDDKGEGYPNFKMEFEAKGVKANG